MRNLLPEILTPEPVAEAIAETCAVRDAASQFEQMAVSDGIETLSLFRSGPWLGFCAEVQRLFDENDYALLRGFPLFEDGAGLLVAALTIGQTLRTYRGDKVIKTFKMSPWTKELSHTTKGGEFHTDLNTEPRPPAITAIQCLVPDPGSPRYGVTRIARLRHLLEFVDRDGDTRTQRFLKEDTVAMLNDRASVHWRGRIVETNAIRYHPDTIRAAARRAGLPLQGLERCMTGVEQAAMSVSTSFVMQRGDILLLSNHRTLHYRGPCSVVFRDFPTEFDSRRVAVLHVARERHKP